MRDDLLDAQAAVDWAVAQFDSLKGRLISWREEPPYCFWGEDKPEMQKKIIRFREAKLPPPIINAEVGAIINSLRSSLDILATSVVARATGVAPKDAYFPIARDRAEWNSGGYKGAKLIKRLPKPDYDIIENLEPWRGGNNPLLIALHDLDITRKHRRLIVVSVNPINIIIPIGSLRRGFQMRPAWAGFYKDAIVAMTGLGDTDYSNIHLALEVTFAEGGPVEREHVISALEKFASLANSIIKFFDK